MTAAIYARKSTDQSGVSDEQRSVRDRWSTPEPTPIGRVGECWRSTSTSTTYQRCGIRQPSRIPAPDECLEASSAVSGADHVGGITPRPRSNRDRIRPQAAHSSRSAYSSTSRTASARSTDAIMLSLTTFADELEYGKRVDLPERIGTIFRSRQRKRASVPKRNGTLFRERNRHPARSLTSWPARRPGVPNGQAVFGN
jgi:hypothetical protein